ncbi:DUF5719 family protein [Knoellia sp. Soil729]|uniref:DUF5719 family protein n=1 Tax=Knoellia sp. Soil729 TaxID=1736394 RepID=UPI0006F8F602|nr:DUF5719 family protein [Knoellia sp. Soil729]KRE43700.1 hypothetical protein ASG74_02330 [Knoellia sp. Soil729]
MNRARLVGPVRLALTAAAAGGLVTLAALSPVTGAEVSGATTQGTTRGTTLEPVATASLSCPGPELSGVKGVEDITVPARLAVATAPDSALAPVKAQGSGRVQVRSGDEVATTTTKRGVTAVDDTVSAGPSEVLATGALAPGLAATQEWSVVRPELRGLATVPCASPGSDLWLLAGGGAPGRQERLILSNPGANEVTVDLQVLGRKGFVPSPTGSTVVPAHGRVAMLVDAISGAEESPAVHVRATGGTVRAVMSDIWLAGSVAVGAETTVPTAAPSKTQVIPAYITGDSGSLRVAVPGSQQAVVSAQVLGPDGASPLGGALRVPARSTGELPVKGLKPGRYAVRVTADVPVVASMFSAWRSGSRPGDFTWSPSMEPAEGLLGAAFPQGFSRSLILSSTGAPAKATVTWQVKGAWTTKSIDVAQDSTVRFDLGDATAVWVRRGSGTGALRAAVASVGMSGGAPLVSTTPLVETAVQSVVGRAHPVS